MSSSSSSEAPLEHHRRSGAVPPTSLRNRIPRCAGVALLALWAGTLFAAAPTREALEAAAHSVLPAAVADVRALVRLPSITAPGNPHRADKTAVLDAVVARAAELGLAARVLEGGEVAVVELPGPPPALGVLAHADVVPPGDPARWRHPPFAAVLAEGAVWGRGAADDKGPLVAVLHAMAIVRDLGVPLEHAVRLIVGTSEENMDWRDLDAVTAAGLVPPEGFAADAAFPVIHAEKSFLDAQARFARSGADPVIESLAGGTVVNAVPESATVTLRSADPQAAAALLGQAVAAHTAAHPDVRFTLERNGPALALRAHGRAAHGSRPDAGVNAAAHLAVLLHGVMQPLGVAADSAEGRALRFLAERVGLEHDGAGLELTHTHPDLGATTVNLGLLDSDAQAVTVALNIRLPVGFPLAAQRERLVAALAPYGGELVQAAGMEALWMDPQAPLVQRLARVYQRMTGAEQAAPIGIGGTTYAKAFPGFVAFGMGFPGDRPVAHAPDEHLRVERLAAGIAIYAAALLELAAGIEVTTSPMASPQ